MAKRRKSKKQDCGINPEDTVKATAPSVVEKDTFSDRPTTTAIEDIQWVSEHLSIPDLTMEDAPSARAWDWYTRHSKTPETRGDFDRMFMQNLVKADATAGKGRFYDEEKRELKKLDEFVESSRYIHEHGRPIEAIA